MKKRGILWLVFITIALQLGGYTLLDWQAGQLINPVIKAGKSYAITMDLSNACNFALSFNKKYLACLNDEKLIIIDLTLNKVVYTTTGNTGQDPLRSVLTANKVLEFRWLPDRNALVYLAEIEHRIGAVSLYSLDLSAGGTKTFSTEGSSKSPGMPVAKSDAASDGIQPKLDREIGMDVDRIIQIEMSTYTNNLFILYEDSKQSTQLMKIDIMKTVNTISLSGEKISKLAVSNKYGIVYLESRLGDDKSIIAIQGGIRKVLSQAPEDVLLGCQEDNVFIGKVGDSQVSASSENGQVLYEIDRYQKLSGSSTDGTSNTTEDQKTSLWRGKIPYNDVEAEITTGGQILLLSKERLDVISAKGVYRSLNLPVTVSDGSLADRTEIIISSTGDLYFELRPQEKKSVYYWREI